MPLLSHLQPALYPPPDACRYLELQAPRKVAVLGRCSDLAKLTELVLATPIARGVNLAALAAGSMPQGLHTLWCEDTLSFIPPALAAATWLRRLGLRNELGPIRLDPAGLDSLVSLTALELQQCLLEAPPPQLSALTALRQLRLSWNPLGGSVAAPASWTALSAMQHLSSLSLQFCQLRELPVVLSKLSMLKVGACYTCTARFCHPHATAVTSVVFSTEIFGCCRSSTFLGIRWRALAATPSASWSC